MIMKNTRIINSGKKQDSVRQVLILGAGNIGKSIAHYLAENKAITKIVLFSNDQEELKTAKKMFPLRKLETVYGDINEKKTERLMQRCDFVFNALPGKIALRGMKLVLKTGKNLIDVSDIDYAEYIGFHREAMRKGIMIIPECGFSPGLMNLVIGFETSNFQIIENIEVRAGTLAQDREYFFPVTWNVSDMIEEHLLKATLVKNGKRQSMPPFSGYQEERDKKVGIFETYFAEGLGSLPFTKQARNMSYRIIRPLGFASFFQYLKNHGFFENQPLFIQGKRISPRVYTETLLSRSKEDNIALLFMVLKGKKENVQKRIVWKIFSSAKKYDKLNSMQKITGLVPTTIFQSFLEGNIQHRGIISMEKIGRDKKVFWGTIRKLRKQGISVQRKI